jgi:hypothetical protein
LNVSVSICGIGQQIRRLQVPQSLIQPVLDLHEQIVATFFDDMAILYNDYAIHLADRGKTMRNGDHGSADYEHFPADSVEETQPTMASEDFGSFGVEWHVPSVFWFVGGVDRDVYAKAKRDGTIGALPTNHSPYFAPVIHPTVEAGVETLVVAALAWLGN